MFVLLDLQPVQMIDVQVVGGEPAQTPSSPLRSSPGVTGWSWRILFFVEITSRPGRAPDCLSDDLFRSVRFSRVDKIDSAFQGPAHHRYRFTLAPSRTLPEPAVSSAAEADSTDPESRPSQNRILHTRWYRPGKCRVKKTGPKPKPRMTAEKTDQSVT